MKKIILALLLIISYVNVQASKGLIKEIKGREYSLERGQRVREFTNALKVGKNYYVVGKKHELQLISAFIIPIPISRSTDFIIFKLDAKMNVKSVGVIPAEFDHKDVKSYTLKQFGDNLCVFFYFNNRKVHKQYLFAQMVNIETLEADGDPYKIGETSITKHEAGLRCIFKVDVSADNTKMLITADRSLAPMSGRAKKIAKSQKSHTLSYSLIDKNFRLLNSCKNVKIGKGGTEIIDQAFDNAGNMCFLAFEGGSKAKPLKYKKTKTVVDEFDQEKDQNQAKLIMKIIKTDGTETDLSFAKGEFFYSAVLKLHPKTGNVAVVGLLASGRNGAKGIFTQQVNLNTGEVLTEAVQAFGPDLIHEINNLQPLPEAKKNKKEKKKSAFEQEREAARQGKETGKKNVVLPKDYIPRLVRLGACHYNENNELVVVTQKYHTYTVTTVYRDGKGNSRTETTRYYVFGDIISFKINDEGGIDNFGFIFHTNEFFADIGKDYSSLYSGQKLFLISRLEACHMELNNAVSKTEPFKEFATYKTKKSWADFMNVTDNELIHVLSSKKTITFTSLSVNVDND